MDRKNIRVWLERFRQGDATLDETAEALARMPYENIGFAQIDHHRELRQGFPEVIYAEGKTKEQTRAIFLRLLEESQKSVMATRISSDMAAYVREAAPEAEYDETARILFVRRNVEPPDESRRVLVLTAGTSDIPVAREAALTAELMGNAVDVCFDVGVAGIHRLFAHEQEILRASVIVVVAGMEGALASVVGGMTACPVIAVPTSVGYGASFHGLSALLAMLNSCAAGVAVMNIDNGYGAGVLASKINKMR
ncbi:MAG: nickel pincer cofactor biosynthesis protein LarB [Schwartzia sp.]|nr:nickel pincer cofactor biosynthesis protein LarB [Schwartzia sp. (in: firmicutes)]